MDNVNRRFRRTMVIPFLMLAVLTFGFSSSSATVKAKKQATINFVHLGSIDDWHAEGDKAILIETVNDRWYRAEFFSPCISLAWQESVAFITSPRGQLNRFSAIVVRGERCQFQNLEEIPAPSQTAKR